MDKLYTIIEVATKLNLSDKTLRRWEEAGKFMPERTLGNQRRYTLEDLQILDAIKHGTVSGQKDLLTIAQAGRLCGVSTTTILRWEDAGKIHPFITSGNTYYPRQKLMEKMDELKSTYVEPAPPAPTPYTPGVKDAHTPGVLATDPEHVPVGARHASPASNDHLSDNPVPKLTPLDTRASHVSPQQFNIYLTNTLITLILIFSYHLIFNQSSVPVSPQTGSVQGASTIATPDPRLDDLITQFKNHLAGEMLKDAKPVSTTIKVTESTLTSSTGIMPKNQNQILVPSEKITTTTPVTVTFTSDFSPAKKYWITTDQGSFTLHTDFPVSSDSTFNYSFIAPIIPTEPATSQVSTPSAKLL